MRDWHVGLDNKNNFELERFFLERFTMGLTD